MTAKAIDYRESILSKISDLSDEKLALFDEYLRTITGKENSSAIILSYAGVFNDIDNEVLAGLTINLSENRIAQTSDFLKG
jgi:hypothetical protein